LHSPLVSDFKTAILNDIPADIIDPVTLTAEWTAVRLRIGVNTFSGYTVDELGMGDNAVYKVWLFLVRFVAPLSVVVIFLNAIKLI